MNTLLVLIQFIQQVTGNTNRSVAVLQDCLGDGIYLFDGVTGTSHCLFQVRWPDYPVEMGFI